MKPAEKNVKTCTNCPFADDGVMIGDGEWSCHAAHTPEGWPRYLHGSRSPKTPPKWCPLRTAPILVTLTRRS